MSRRGVNVLDLVGLSWEEKLKVMDEYRAYQQTDEYKGLMHAQEEIEEGRRPLPASKKGAAPMLLRPYEMMFLGMVPGWNQAEDYKRLYPNGVGGPATQESKQFAKELAGKADKALQWSRQVPFGDPGGQCNCGSSN